MTPDGRIAVAFYDATPTPQPRLDWTAAFFDVFGADPGVIDAFSMVLSESLSLLWAGPGSRPSSIEVSVNRTATKVKVTGAVVPQPLAGARVTVTLFQDDGGGFDQVTRKRPRTGIGGGWATSFGRLSDGRCRVVVEFDGSEGRQPSVPVTRTFAC